MPSLGHKTMTGRKIILPALLAELALIGGIACFALPAEAFQVETDPVSTVRASHFSDPDDKLDTISENFQDGQSGSASHYSVSNGSFGYAISRPDSSLSYGPNFQSRFGR